MGIMVPAVVDGIIVDAVVTGVELRSQERRRCCVAGVVKGTGAALPRWDEVPVLKTVSVPYWFDTVSLTSYDPSNGYR